MWHQVPGGGLTASMAAWLSGFVALMAANVLWGGQRVRVGAGVVAQSLLLGGREVPRWMQLGGWTTYRRLLSSPELRSRVNLFVGFTRPLRRRVPKRYDARRSRSVVM